MYSQINFNKNIYHGTPDFVAPTTTIDKTMVWIRFLGINLVFYDESSLLALAAMVGSPFIGITSAGKTTRSGVCRT